MADTFTPNLNLIKPDVVKDALIGDINGNMDLIDAFVAAVNARGVWQDYTCSIRVGGAGAAATGTSISVARYTVIGKTVLVYGEGSTSALVSNFEIMLPAAAGVPIRRFLNAGSAVIFNGGGAAPAQAGIGRMTTGKDRINLVSTTNAFLDLPASSTVQWNLAYEIV